MGNYRGSRGTRAGKKTKQHQQQSSSMPPQGGASRFQPSATYLAQAPPLVHSHYPPSYSQPSPSTYPPPYPPRPDDYSRSFSHDSHPIQYSAYPPPPQQHYPHQYPPPHLLHHAYPPPPPPPPSQTYSTPRMPPPPAAPPFHAPASYAGPGPSRSHSLTSAYSPASVSSVPPASYQRPVFHPPPLSPSLPPPPRLSAPPPRPIPVAPPPPVNTAPSPTKLPGRPIPPPPPPAPAALERPVATLPIAPAAPVDTAQEDELPFSLPVLLPLPNAVLPPSAPSLPASPAPAVTPASAELAEPQPHPAASLSQPSLANPAAASSTAPASPVAEPEQIHSAPPSPNLIAAPQVSSASVIPPSLPVSREPSVPLSPPSPEAKPQDDYISLAAPSASGSAAIDADEAKDPGQDGQVSDSEAEESDVEVADALMRPASTSNTQGVGPLGLAMGDEGEDSATEDVDVSFVETAAPEERSDEEEERNEEEEGHGEEHDDEDFSDLEVAVQPHPDEADEEEGEEHDLPFDLGSGSESEEVEGGEEDGLGDESADLSLILSSRRSKRRRLNGSALKDYADSVADTDLDDDTPTAPQSRDTSRAPSIDPQALDAYADRPTKPLPHRRGLLAGLMESALDAAVDIAARPQEPDARPRLALRDPQEPQEPQQPQEPEEPQESAAADAVLSDAPVASLDASTTSLIDASTAPSELPPSADPQGEEEDEVEEGELLEEGELPLESAYGDYPPPFSLATSSFATSLAGLHGGPSSAYSGFNDSPALGGVAGQILPSTSLGASPRASPGPSTGLINGKASYQRRVPPALGAVPANASTSHPDAPAQSPSFVDATAASPFPSSSAPPPAKGVYVRRQPTQPDGTPAPSPMSTPAESSHHGAPLPSQADVAAAAAAAAKSTGKASYERPAGAANAEGSVSTPRERKKGAKQNKKEQRQQEAKKGGVLPLTDLEKASRLPQKLYAAFPDFATLEDAAVPTLFSPPPHSVNPAKNLPPPTESATYGFWPSPPVLQPGKAVFPAPPVPLPEAPDDPRPRVDIFIDNSNVLYSFLNWVRARPDAKITSKVHMQKGKPKTVKTVTLGGKKVKMDYNALFALLERGRKVERRVLVGSSTLWQTLEPAIEWGYEVSLLQRVARAEPSATPSTAASTQQPAPQQQTSKKRMKNGKLKKVPIPQQQQPVQATVKHYKEQAVDELVHLKILETLLDHTPFALPLVQVPPPQSPAPVNPPAELEAGAEPAEDQTQHLDGETKEIEHGEEVAHGRVNGNGGEVVTPAHADDHVEAIETRMAPADTDTDIVETVSKKEEMKAEDEPVQVTIMVEQPNPIEQAQASEEADVDTVGSAEEDSEFSTPIDALAEAVQGSVVVHAGTSEAEVVEDARTGVDISREEKKEDGDEEGGNGGNGGGGGDAAEGQASAAETAAPLTAAPEVTAVTGTTAAEAAEAPVTAAEEQDQPMADVGEASGTVPSPTPLAPVAIPAPPVPCTTPRFLPSAAYTSGKATTANATPKFIPASEVPKPKFTPAQPKITPAPPKPPPPPLLSNPSVLPVVPRSDFRDRPTLVIATGDANSSEYNPGGFLGCVRRALDRGWDVEVAAFTHGLSSHWTAEQQKRVTEEGRERGQLRVINLGTFAEELCV
ncbi:hypothetical protein JCM11641_006819 [Rhodosporidiobolus odoratus]